MSGQVQIPASLPRLFLIAAAVCFIVALFLALGTFSGSNQVAWMIGGLLSLTLAFLFG